MSEDVQRVLWVNVPLKGADVEKFARVKMSLGIRSNTDVVRHLLTEADRRLGTADAQPPSEGEPRTETV